MVRGRVEAAPRFAGVSSLTSSMTAAIAVLKLKRSPMSVVTLSIAQCALRISSRSDSDKFVDTCAS